MTLAARRQSPKEPTRAGAADVPNEPRPPSPITGEDLAAPLQAWCRANGASPIRLGLYLFASKQGLAALANTKRPKTATVAKVRAFLDDPVPPDRLPLRATRRTFAPRVNPNPTLAITTVDDAIHMERRKQRVKRSIRKQAAAALDAGISPHKASPNAGVRGAMKQIVEHRAAAERASSPVEKAKTLIRSRGHNCFEAWVTLGEKKGRGKFFINNDLVDEQELLARAARITERLAANG